MTAGLSVHRVLGAIRDRVDVFRRSANGVAGGNRERDPDQDHSRRFLEHFMFSF
jgi:hypothetical protein